MLAERVDEVEISLFSESLKYPLINELMIESIQQNSDFYPYVLGVLSDDMETSIEFLQQLRQALEDQGNTLEHDDFQSQMLQDIRPLIVERAIAYYDDEEEGRRHSPVTMHWLEATFQARIPADEIREIQEAA